MAFFITRAKAAEREGEQFDLPSNGTGKKERVFASSAAGAGLTRTGEKEKKDRTFFDETTGITFEISCRVPPPDEGDEELIADLEKFSKKKKKEKEKKKEKQTRAPVPASLCDDQCAAAKVCHERWYRR